MSSTPGTPWRVALVASSLRLGGAEKQTMYLARALGQAGLEVRLYYLGSGGYYERVIRDAGVPVQQIFVPNRPWSILARLVRALRRFRPHLAMAAQFSDLNYAAPAGRFVHALVIGGVRSDGLYELSTQGWRGRWLARLAHGLVANSRRARQNLEARGIPAEKIEVLPNVIDLAEFDAQSALALAPLLPADRVVAVAVGSLHSCKRFDRFLEALARARQREPALAGIIAGSDGGVEAALRGRAAALGLTAQDLLFLGECDRVPALLTRAALLVLTSDYEGFPNVILEAMAAGLPVISVPAGDASTIVQAGANGWIVDPEDIPGMADGMVRLAQSPAMRREFGKAGRHRVEREYNLESLPDRLLAVLGRLACRQRRSPVGTLLDGAAARGQAPRDLPPVDRN
ncbi:MAG: glycosyltransferase family 4 protein [Verrucomicrobia bacterium]|nr:glycosyltransferase family 4 protein [Verrucomicrobiota bacterium]